MFEFDVLCKTYDYASSKQKMNMFPITLKDATLHWFMSLARGKITT